MQGYLFQKHSHLSNDCLKKGRISTTEVFPSQTSVLYHRDGTIRTLESLDWALNLGLRGICFPVKSRLVFLSIGRHVTTLQNCKT